MGPHVGRRAGRPRTRMVDLDVSRFRNSERGRGLQPRRRWIAVCTRPAHADGEIDVTVPCQNSFIGIQISPISFIDEGVDEVLDTLRHRVGVNALLIGTISWLGLKVGRRISHALEGWPDHGVAAPYSMEGGSYIKVRPEYYTGTFIKDFTSRDPEMRERDILEVVGPKARERGMKIIPEFMEPLFKYAGHGS